MQTSRAMPKAGRPRTSKDVWTLHYAAPKHISQCTQLAAQFWPNDDTGRYRDQIGEMFRSKNGPKFFVITSGDKLAGFAGLRESWIMPKTFELIGINVSREHQHEGFGRVLTEVRLELIKAIGGSYVILSTIRPWFFERFGFEAVDKDDRWTIMRKTL